MVTETDTCWVFYRSIRLLIGTIQLATPNTYAKLGTIATKVVDAVLLRLLHLLVALDTAVDDERRPTQAILPTCMNVLLSACVSPKHDVMARGLGCLGRVPKPQRRAKRQHLVGRLVNTHREVCAGKRTGSCATQSGLCSRSRPSARPAWP